MNDFKDVFGFSVSHTTRAPRPGEVDGKDYHYVSREVMQDGIDNDEFIESAIYAGNMYGTRYNDSLLNLYTGKNNIFKKFMFTAKSLFRMFNSATESAF